MHITQFTARAAGCRFRNSSSNAVTADEGGSVNLINATIVDNTGGIYAIFGGQIRASRLAMERNSQPVDLEGNSTRLYTDAAAAVVGDALQIRPLSAAPQQRFLQPDDPAFLRLQEVCCCDACCLDLPLLNAWLSHWLWSVAAVRRLGTMHLSLPHCVAILLTSSSKKYAFQQHALDGTKLT